jgi:hypothetical protein
MHARDLPSSKGATNMPSEIDMAVPESDLELIKRYGISRTPADYFHCGQYRYTALKDAIAQAERNKSSSR